VKSRQLGSTAIEFALVLFLFFTFMLGITDFSRMLYSWNAANEATRAGARYAVVCDNTADAAQVLTKMQALMPQVQSINLAWDPAGCDASSCVGVNVTITNLNYQWISPIAGLARLAPIAMPSFSTYLTRESMRQDAHSGDMC
jgi:Flp pilus assembly protein TadG